MLVRVCIIIIIIIIIELLEKNTININIQKNGVKELDRRAQSGPFFLQRWR